MYCVNDVYIDVINIRKMYYEEDGIASYLVIVYAFDEEHPTRIMVKDKGEYIYFADMVSEYIREREGK